METTTKKPLTAREKRRLKWWKERQVKSSSKEENSQTKVDLSSDSKRKQEEALSQTSTLLEATPKKKKSSKKKYYIVFVGNLPFSVTEKDINEHFMQIGSVKDVRLLTDKETGKSRGCAYVELENERTHKRALQMHHSELCGRKINVEFTSAGRKTTRRMAKLKEKNLKAARFRIPPGTTLPKTGREPKSKTGLGDNLDKDAIVRQGHPENKPR